MKYPNSYSSQSSPDEVETFTLEGDIFTANSPALVTNVCPKGDVQIEIYEKIQD